MVITTGDGQRYEDRFDQLSQQFWPAQEGSNVLSFRPGADTFGERFSGQTSNDPRNREATRSIKQKDKDESEGGMRANAHGSYEDRLRLQHENDPSQRVLPPDPTPEHIDFQHGRVASNYPNPFEDVGKYTPKAPTSAPEPPKPLWPHELLNPTPPALWYWEHHTDNEHHVPLIASGILDDAGNMTGLAIDHRVDVPKEYLPHLALHEATEIPLMHDYMADGMTAQDAYHKAHDIATATESASVRAHAARNGLDVESYHEGYKQFFRDAARAAGEPSDRQRHPRTHTTVHGLDEAEGAYKIAGDVVEGNFPQRVQHPPLEIDLLSGKMPQGVGVARGSKAAKKTEDIEQSAKTANSPYFKSSGKSMQKLDFATMKRDQYNTWLKENKGTVRRNIPANENQIKTDLEHMEELKDNNPDQFKYWREFYRQRGGKDWQRWEMLEGILDPAKALGLEGEGMYGKPTKGQFEVIEGGKE